MVLAMVDWPEGTRLYNTRDLARYASDGSIIFLAARTRRLNSRPEGRVEGDLGKASRGPSSRNRRRGGPD
jgi:hypothetical protein